MRYTTFHSCSSSFQLDVQIAADPCPRACWDSVTVLSLVSLMPKPCNRIHLRFEATEQTMFRVGCGCSARPRSGTLLSFTRSFHFSAPVPLSSRSSSVVLLPLQQQVGRRTLLACPCFSHLERKVNVYITIAL